MKKQWSTIKLLLWIILCLSVTALIVLFVLNFRYLSTHFTENNPHGELFKVVLTIIAGIIAIVALYYNHRRVTAIEKGNVDTRFNNAVGHLGDENPTVVLGDIHALHQIAVKHESYTQVVHNLFCSYLRENSAKLYDEKTPDKCPVIIQTLINYLFKPYNEEDSVYKDLKSDLSFSTLKNCRFGYTLTNCNFGKATLTECNFSDTIFTNCYFTEATFNGDLPLFIGSVFINCHFGGVTFTNCHFSGTTFTNCDFNYAALTKCFFISPSKRTTLTNCDFRKVTLTKCGFISNTPHLVYSAELFDCNLENIKLIDTELPPNKISKA